MVANRTSNTLRSGKYSGTKSIGLLHFDNVRSIVLWKESHRAVHRDFVTGIDYKIFEEAYRLYFVLP